MYNTPGGEDGYSRAEYLRYMRKGDAVPDLSPSLRCMGLIGYYNVIRSFAGVVDNPITMRTVEEWQAHSYVVLERWERECIFAMDRAFRQSYGEVLKYHAERKQIKVGKGRDWGVANG